MKGRRKVILLGSGALATAIVEALSLSELAVDVYLYSRSLLSSEWLATVGNTRSRKIDGGVRFIARQLDWQSQQFLLDELRAISPTVLIHTASLQSMWSLKRNSRWSILVKSTGYGVTLPLQCVLARRVARVCGEMEHPPLFINCCYPDAVNWVLAQSGCQVFSGIGNIGIIDMVLSASEDRVKNHRMLANHFHVQELFKPVDQRTQFPRVWVNGEEVQDTREIFNKILLLNEPTLNAITALTCTDLLEVVLTKSKRVLHLAAPKGRPGGYPVQTEGGRITSIGTGTISIEDAQQWNLEVLSNEGIVMDEKTFRFSDDARRRLAEVSIELANGFSYDDIDEYSHEFVKLRAKLE